MNLLKAERLHLLASPRDGLLLDFLEKFDALVLDCAEAGVIMKPVIGIRDPVTQGKLWRQSRLSSEVKHKIAELRADGCTFLAACIDKAGPCDGPHVTNAIPGLSWHQWKAAMDSVWLREGKICDNATIDGAKNGYRIFAAKAEAHGLTSLGPTSLGDWEHVQLQKESGPHKIHSMSVIDRMMRMMFEHLLEA